MMRRHRRLWKLDRGLERQQQRKPQYAQRAKQHLDVDFRVN